MEDNNFGNYGVQSGYGQPTAGRDVAKFRQPGQPGRPRMAPQPVAQPAPAAPPADDQPADAQPFAGAVQTIGAQPMRERTHGGPGFNGAPNWMGNAMGAAPVARGPQAVPSSVGAYEQGGITGAVPQPVQAPSAGPAGTPTQTPASPVNLDFSRMTGYDQTKWDANKQDAKYQMGRTLAQFDPRGGITPEVVEALNKLGYGTFSGQGDKLALSGLTEFGRQHKLSGDYTGADFIQGFKSGNGKWGYADPVAEAAETGSLSPELLAILQGGDIQQQTAVPTSGGEQQFNSERMRAQILQALQQAGPR